MAYYYKKFQKSFGSVPLFSAKDGFILSKRIKENGLTFEDLQKYIDVFFDRKMYLNIGSSLSSILCDYSLNKMATFPEFYIREKELCRKCKTDVTRKNVTDGYCMKCFKEI